MASNQGNSNLPNNPTIRKSKFSKESDGKPEKYCQRIIDQHNDRKDAKYEKTSNRKTSNSRVITYTKSNDENGETCTLYFVLHKDSIYCFRKGPNVPKAVVQDQDQDFGSRARRVIAADSESPIYRGGVRGIETRVHEQVFEVKEYLRVNPGKGAQLKITKDTLTIMKKLSLEEIVDLIEYLDAAMSEREYYMFHNDLDDTESTVDLLGKKLSKTKIR